MLFKSTEFLTLVSIYDWSIRAYLLTHSERRLHEGESHTDSPTVRRLQSCAFPSFDSASYGHIPRTLFVSEYLLLRAYICAIAVHPPSTLSTEPYE